MCFFSPDKLHYRAELVCVYIYESVNGKHYHESKRMEAGRVWNGIEQLKQSKLEKKAAAPP